MELSQQDDQALWEAFLGGDQAALGTLAQRYRTVVMGRLCRLTGDYDAAEDLWQDTLLHLLAKREVLGDVHPVHFGAWLGGCARHQWLAQYAKAQRRAELLREEVAPQMMAVEEAEALQDMGVAAVQQAIGQVTHPLRRELLQQLAQGFSVEELAIRYQRKAAWVYQNVYRARQDLRRQLG